MEKKREGKKLKKRKKTTSSLRCRSARRKADSFIAKETMERFFAPLPLSL